MKHSRKSGKFERNPSRNVIAHFVDYAVATSSGVETSSPSRNSPVGSNLEDLRRFFVASSSTKSRFDLSYFLAVKVAREWTMLRSRISSCAIFTPRHYDSYVFPISFHFFFLTFTHLNRPIFELPHRKGTRVKRRRSASTPRIVIIVLLSWEISLSLWITINVRLELPNAAAAGWFCAISRFLRSRRRASSSERRPVTRTHRRSPTRTQSPSTAQISHWKDIFYDQSSVVH